MNRDQIILQLQQDYMKRREDNLRLYEQRVDEACERCPGLRELLNARHALVLGGIRASLVERKEGSSQQLPNAMSLLNGFEGRRAFARHPQAHLHLPRLPGRRVSV